MSIFLQIILSSLEAGSVYALAALGLIIIFRTSLLINFAHGAMGMVNAFVATNVVMKLVPNPFLAALAGMFTALLLGIIIDRLIIQHMPKTAAVSTEIVTFGLIILLYGIAPLIFGTMPLAFPRFIGEGQLKIIGATVTYNALFNIAVGIILTFALFYFLQKTVWGLAVRATASNAHTAQLMGVPTSLVNMGAWGVAGMLGVLSALMLAPAITVNISMMDGIQVFALLACVLGGFQTFYGPVVGAYIIALGKNMLSFYVSSTWGEALMYLFVLVFIIFKPHGLFSVKIAKKV